MRREGSGELREERERMERNEVEIKRNLSQKR